MGLWDAIEEVSVEEIESKNKYLDNYEEGMKFLSKVLSINYSESSIDRKLDAFYQLIDKDYVSFSSKERLPNEVEVYNKLLKLKDGIEELVKFPFITGKNIIAIGGGFSAGKSRFINSILKEEILPTDTRPTTSIPTYIVSGNKSIINSFNIFGSKADIDTEGVEAISHAFYEKYKLSFTKILKNILIQSVGMKKQHIVFLDTPGYTKADFHKKEDNTDETIARKHLATSDYLLWLIDIEKGTIPNEDLEFIKSLNFNKPIFFIFTKADKKQESDIKEILKIARQNIENANINIEGITAYSSIDNKEYLSNSLSDFIEKVNHEKEHSKLIDESEEIFNIYKEYSESQIKDKKRQLELFNKLAIFSKNNEEIPMINEFRENIKKDIIKQKSFLNEVNTLKEKFNSAIIDVIKEISKDMQKGQNVDLTIANPELNKILVELGWDDNKYNDEEIDLNLSVFLLNNKELVDYEENFVFYNNLISKDASVVYTGDNNTKSVKSKVVEVDLGKVDKNVSKLVFVSNIYEAKERAHDFGKVSNAYIRILRENDKEEILRYNLEKEYNSETTLVFGELMRNNNEWKFNAIGKGSNDGLEIMCEKYGIDVE